MSKKRHHQKRPSWDFRLGDIKRLEYADDRKTATVTLLDGTTRSTSVTFTDAWPQGAFMDPAGKTYDIG